MIEKSRLRQVVILQNTQLHQDLGIKRNFSIKPLENFATIISGLRRCGKSTLLRQHLSEKNKVNYINFEDIRLASFEMSDFEKLEEIFSENQINSFSGSLDNDSSKNYSEENRGRNPEENSKRDSFSNNSEIYFFDEIQNIKGWEIYVRMLLERKKEVYVTGSNATLMSSELGTRLTGRSIRYELFPFDFDEYSRAKKSARDIDLFEKYLYDGGIPEYVLQDDVRILQGLLNDIIYRDLLVRHKLRDEAAAKSIVMYLLSNSGKETSFNKIGEIFGVAPNTVISMINALSDAYLIYILNMFDYSLKKQQRNPKKIYCVDNGLITHASFQFSKNKGALLENLAFIELRRRGLELYYHKKKHECNFLVKEGMNITGAIQVCYELTPDNQNREINGLIEAMKEYNLNEGTILTFNQEDSFYIEGFRINLIPLYKFEFKLRSE